jgi:hypothetical protein
VQAQKISPIFTGIPQAPTPVAGTATTQIATTAFVINSPAFAGTPTAPTASNATNSGQLATTAFVKNTVNNLGTMSIQNANAVSITGGSVTGITDLAIADGGTGASTPAQARLNLELASGATTIVGNMAVQNNNAVNITGGTITGVTISGIPPLPVLNGGTGASTAAGARTNLGVPDAVAITITGTGGLTGGGDLTASRTISIAGNSNGYGQRYVSSAFPSNATGVDGDIWYQI